MRGRGASFARGFTLVELMITLAVAAVLLVIAVPSFRSIMLSSRLDTTANDLIAALNTARMEAIKANASAQFCSNSATVNTSSTLGSACGTEVGAVMLTTVTGSGPAATKVRSGLTSITGGIQLDGDVQAIRYGGDGLGRVPGSSAPASVNVADICTSALTTDNHRVVSITSGSVVAVSKDTRTCP
ncbi:MAG: GspH/FimT family pseudopilin [Pseudomonadota bacterium]